MKIFEKFFKKRSGKMEEIGKVDFQNVKENEMDELRLLKERILSERLRGETQHTAPTPTPSLEKPPMFHAPFSISEIPEEKSLEHLKKEGESGKKELALERIDARLETILAKLEAINERLKVIEEKLERRY